MDDMLMDKDTGAANPEQPPATENHEKP